VKPTKMTVLLSLQIATRILISKHSKLCSSYLVKQNVTMWKSCF